MYIKILQNGQACHGGDYAYSLPVQQPDGSWLPGEWHHLDDRLRLIPCLDGFHVTDEYYIHLWWLKGAEAYEAELGKEVIQHEGSKYVARDIRLLRRLSADELAKWHIYTGGGTFVEPDCYVHRLIAIVNASGQLHRHQSPAQRQNSL